MWQALVAARFPFSLTCPVTRLRREPRQAVTWTPLATRPGRAHSPGMIKVAISKIAQLVADATIELKRLGIDTKGKRSDELLNMAREERNHPRVTPAKPDDWDQ